MIRTDATDRGLALIVSCAPRSSMKFRTGSRSSRSEIQNSLAMLEVCWD
jgi:hypothetical protein